MIIRAIYRISLNYATFGIEVAHDKVFHAAPIAKWTIGKKIEEVFTYYRRKGAQIERVA